MAAKRTVAASVPQLLVGASALIFTVILATASAWEIYGSGRVGVVAAVGLAVGAGSVLAGIVFGWRWWGIGLVALGGFLVAAVPTAVPGATSSVRAYAKGLVDVIAGLILGWKQLLTISLPAGDYQAVLLPFFVTVLGCSLTAFALMAYGRRWAPLAVIPMIAMVLFGAVFGASAPANPLHLGPWTIENGSRAVLTFATLAVCAAWLIANARIQRARAMRAAQSGAATARLGRTSVAYTLRRQAFAFTIVSIALVGALTAAPIATSFGARQVLRDAVDPLVVVRAQTSPLVDYRAWYSGDTFSEPLFDVTGAEGTDRLRIATLAAYDGETYQVPADAQFYRQPGDQRRALTITIREGYEGIWVPIGSANGGAPIFVGPRAVELADSYYADVANNVGVVVASADGDEPGLRPGDKYHVSAAKSADPQEIESVQGGDPKISAEDYPQLAGWVELQELGRSGGDLTELIDRLVSRGYISHATREGTDSTAWVGSLKARSGYVFEASRSGHSAARVDELFAAMATQQRDAGPNAQPADLVSAVGDDEQFATAAALLAAYLGFDSRVVEGVRLGDIGTDLAVEPCTETCTGANVAVWTEVRAPSGTWVTYDATPQFEASPLLVKQGQTLPENPTEPDQVASDVVEPPVIDNEHTANRADIDDPDPSWVDSYLPLVITIAVLVIGSAVIFMPLFVFPFAKRARRRWRRKNAVPEVAMVGAWLELVDTYVDLGIEVPYALTRAETADVLGRQNATTLAAVVDRAVFAEHPPTREASEATWQIFDDERQGLVQEYSWWRRAQARMAVASLLRAARKDVRVMRSGLIRKDRHDG